MLAKADVSLFTFAYSLTALEARVEFYEQSRCSSELLWNDLCIVTLPDDAEIFIISVGGLRF